MQVSVESTGNIQRKMTVVLPAADAEKEVEKRLRSMRGKVRLDGFRPGKVPLSIIKQRYGQSTYYEVVNELIPTAFANAIKQEQLSIATYPEYEPSKMGLGEDLHFTALFEVYPQFDIASVDDLNIQQPEVDITETDIDNMIETLRKQQQEWAEVERPAQEEDQVTLDFEGSLNGEVFEGGTANDYEVTLGEGRMLKDFESALKGMSAGDEKVADVTFPEDYQRETLAGQTVQFKLNVHKVSAPKLPEIDAEFMKKFGVNSGDTDDFRVDVRRNMERQLQRNVRQYKKEQVMAGLADLHDIDLPRGLVESETQQLREELQQNSGQQYQNMNNLPDMIFETRASERVKLGLIVGELVKQKNLSQDNERVEQRLREEISDYEKPEEAYDYFKNDEKTMTQIRAAVLEDMVVEWVTEHGKVNSTTMDFDTAVAIKYTPPVVEEESTQQEANANKDSATSLDSNETKTLETQNAAND